MSRWFRYSVGIGLGLMLGAAVYLPRMVAQAPAPGQGNPPDERRPIPPPDIQASEVLHQAYDGLGLVSVWTASNQGKLPGDMAGLVDQAKDFYRRACRAYQDRAFGRSAELALAANDATRGLLSYLHANTPPVAGIPAPPEPGGQEATAAARPAAGQRPGGGPPEDRGTGGRDTGGQPPPLAGPDAPRSPVDAARDAFRFARQRIIDASRTEPAKGPARSFLDASRKVYEEGRQAYQKHEYAKAIDLALGAEAWTHVGEHLMRAEGRTEPGRRPGSVPPPDQQRQPRPQEKAPPPRLSGR